MSVFIQEIIDENEDRLKNIINECFNDLSDDFLYYDSESIDKETVVERKGLGTPATRAGVIENLIAKGFVVRDKKNLIITDKGLALITVVSEFLKDSNTTSDWEMKLYNISKGNIREQDFINEIENKIKEIVFPYTTIQ